MSVIGTETEVCFLLFLWELNPHIRCHLKHKDQKKCESACRRLTWPIWLNLWRRNSFDSCYLSPKQIVSNIHRQHWHDLTTMDHCQWYNDSSEFPVFYLSLNKMRNWRNSPENPSYNRRFMKSANFLFLFTLQNIAFSMSDFAILNFNWPKQINK